MVAKYQNEPSRADEACSGVRKIDEGFFPCATAIQQEAVVVVVLPERVALKDIREQKRANFAYKYGLTRDHITVAECMVQSKTDDQIRDHLELTDSQFIRLRRELYEGLGLSKKGMPERKKREAAVAIAVSYGIGID